MNEGRSGEIGFPAGHCSENTPYESEKTQMFYKSFLEMIDTEQDVSELCRLSQEELYKFLVR